MRFRAETYAGLQDQCGGFKTIQEPAEDLARVRPQ
jgi:hypothetical protein